MNRTSSSRSPWVPRPIATLGTSVAIGTINDNDPTPVLSIGDASIGEGGNLVFDVTMENLPSSTVTVNYATANGTAVAPGDYTSAAGQLQFTSVTTSRTITIPTVNDALNEASETLTVTLSGAVNATIATAVGTGTIIDNDGAPGITIIDAAPTSEAAGVMEFTVALLPASGQTVSVTYATTNATAVAPGDFVAIPPTVLTFPPGTTQRTFEVTLTNDGLDEVAETLGVTLTNPVNTTLVDAQAVGTILDANNVAPVISAGMRTTDAGGVPMFQFSPGEAVRLAGAFTDPGTADTHVVSIDWGDGTPVTDIPITPVGTRTFAQLHTYVAEGFYTITASASDADGGASEAKQVFVVVSGDSVAGAHASGLVDPLQGRWYLFDDDGAVLTNFYFGNPGDVPFMGDWNGDGVETPGLYRQSDGFVYLRQTNTQGPADISFFFGNPGDIPIAGDFDNDGFDTVSIYRPSNQTFYIINELGTDGGGLGAAEFSYVFGNPGDKPFVGDFDGDGVETVGLHRESTGLVYFRNSHSQGNADAQFIFGNPDDRLIAGDWNGDGVFSPALFRPSKVTMYFRFTNTAGNADNEFVPAQVGSTWLPISGRIS